MKKNFTTDDCVMCEMIFLNTGSVQCLGKMTNWQMISLERKQQMQQ